MKYTINYNEQGKILGFTQGNEGLNIEVPNATYVEAQKYNKIIVDGDNITFDKVDWRTPEEIAEAQAQEAEAQRKQAMLDGATYNDYQISLTKDDGDGLVQVKSGFELGLTSTTIHFENGTKMPITAEEFPAFASWFVNERNKFFGGINE